MKCARVFLKRAEVCWIDFPLGTAPFQNFVAQLRMDTFAFSEGAYVPLDQVAAIVLIDVAQPTHNIMFAPPAGNA